MAHPASTPETDPGAAFEGSCLCGQVQYRVSGKVLTASHCYCGMCRKQHGASCGSYFSVAQGDFRYTAGEAQVTRYASSPGVTRAFCGRCGSALTWSSTEYPESVGVTLGTLDTPYEHAVGKELFAEQKPAWRPRG